VLQASGRATDLGIVLAANMIPTSYSCSWAARQPQLELPVDRPSGAPEQRVAARNPRRVDDLDDLFERDGAPTPGVVRLREFAAERTSDLASHAMWCGDSSSTCSSSAAS